MFTFSCDKTRNLSQALLCRIGKQFRPSLRTFVADAYPVANLRPAGAGSHLDCCGGRMAGRACLSPPRTTRRPLTQDLMQQADRAFAQIGVDRESFDIRAADGVQLRSWKVHAKQPNGSWVLLFHGVADNRMGVLEHALMLLRAGYGVVLMDARAHGESEGATATYGWLEREDTRSIVDALSTSEHPVHILALGESMGASIALQSAAVDPRIEAVVAEAPFASLREAS